MRAASAPLLALLNSGQQFGMADLYTITLITGTIMRYTSWDAVLTAGANTFSATGPLLVRGKTKTVLGTEVDTLDLEIFPSSTDMIGSLTFLQAAAAGALDGATVLLERAFLSGIPPVFVGSFINFSGRVADMDLTRTGIKIVVKSDLELLNISMPRNLYQPSCLQTLYDSDCGVVRASFAQAGTVASGTNISVNSPGLPQGDKYFDLGYIQFTSGALTGAKRTIKSYASKTLQLLSPMPQPPANGDLFTAYPGCDKTLGVNGCAKFANTSRFKGLPFIPVPETTR